MQRRAAAIYAAFFVVLAAGAYGAIGLAQEPSVTVDDPAHSLSPGDTLTADGRTYTVADVQAGTNEGNDLRSASLAWVNESSRYTAELANNSTVAVTDVSWPDQTARQRASPVNGSTVTVDGTDYTLTVSGDATQATLSTGNESRTIALGDTLRYDGERATVTRITPGGVTFAWGEPYRVLVEDSADPSSVTFTQAFNVTGRLVEDPAVEDETVTRADGERYVVYEANGTTRPLADYLPAPEERRLDEGDTLAYRGNETRVAEVTNTTVTLAWTGPRTNSLSLEEGATTTFGGTEYVAHFPDNSTLALSSDVRAYEAELQAVDTFHERINGFWGITIVAGLAAILLLAAAYLPSRY